MLFHQSNAPNGWTQVTNNTNNRALRVVSNEGGNTGGNMAFTNVFDERVVVLPEHDHNAYAGNQSDDHNHTVTISTHNGHKHSIDDPGHSHIVILTQ